MEVPIYIAEERNYGPDDRIGAAIPPSRVRYSLAPIPKAERVISYREGRATHHRTIRLTGGEEPTATVRAIGELLVCRAIGDRPSPHLPEALILFQFRSGLCVRAEELLRMGRAGEKGCRLAPAIRPPAPERHLTVSTDWTPPGPIAPTKQAAFAW